MTDEPELTWLAPLHYTQRLHPADQTFPDPLALFDVALIIARDPAGGGCTHADAYAGLIRAIWRGEFERRGRSSVFTLEPRKSSFRSEPKQNIGEILASSPAAAPWVDDTGRTYVSDEEDEADRVREVPRRRMRWSRREMLHALVASGNLPLAPLPDQQNACFRLLAQLPLGSWSDHSRALIWDRLCITQRHLTRWWAATRGEPYPAFFGRFAADTVRKPDPINHPPLENKQRVEDVADDEYTQGPVNPLEACKAWLFRLMREEGSEKTKPKLSYLEEAMAKFPGLIASEFRTAWRAAVKATKSGWDKRGRPQKKQKPIKIIR